MQKMLEKRNSYFSGNTLALFLNALVASNLQPILQASQPYIVAQPVVEPIVLLPSWLTGEAASTFIETLRPTVQMLARALHARVAHLLSVSLDDLVQEGLIAVWQCISCYDASKAEREQSFRAYCKIRAKYAMVDYVRMLSREHALSLDAYLSCEDEDGGYQRELADKPITSMASAPTHALQPQIQAALSRLSDPEQQAITGAFSLEDESGTCSTLEDVRTRLALKKSTLYAIKRRALKKLATLLAEQGVLV